MTTHRREELGRSKELASEIGSLGSASAEEIGKLAALEGHPGRHPAKRRIQAVFSITFWAIINPRYGRGDWLKGRAYDVAVIGGGPAGSTVASLLRKYEPSARVLVLERERFPRDHVGESLLPPVSHVLDEMGCWDAVEAAGFPIKIGATYRWGRCPELWDYDFFPPQLFKNEPRPAPYDGQRRFTAFQVDRSIYDKLLLDHAQGLGCEVRQGTRVKEVLMQDDSVTGLGLDSGEEIAANYYVDASGNSGILRRAAGVDCDYPSTLKNVAIYDYWQNAEWAVKIGVKATRIQVRSLGYGWLWFIPLGPTRTSIGLVIPAEHYKKMAKRPEALYREALAQEPTISKLLVNATSEGKVQTTRDWSFLAKRQAGENWFLVGECAGFADPILSAGVSMAHIGARQLAYTILEIERGKIDSNWLRSEYESRQQKRILTHIRFGEFWYTSNKQLTDLKEYTAQLAKDVGLDLHPEMAWDWISRGGFISEDLTIGTGGFSLSSLRGTSGFLTELAVDSPLEDNNILDLDLAGAEQRDMAVYDRGRVERAQCYVRNGRVLPTKGEFGFLISVLKREREFPRIMGSILELARQRPNDPALANLTTGQTLEGMIRDGWVIASYDSTLPVGKRQTGWSAVHRNTDQSV